MVQTKEGVPGPVGEFTHSFSGVNYVEVAWARPFQVNGILTGYSVEVIAGKNFTVVSVTLKQCLSITSDVTLIDSKNILSCMTE